MESFDPDETERAEEAAERYGLSDPMLALAYEKTIRWGEGIENGDTDVWGSTHPDHLRVYGELGVEDSPVRSAFTTAVRVFDTEEYAFGKKAPALVAAACYFAFRADAITHSSQDAIAEAFGVSSDTLRVHYQWICDHLLPDPNAEGAPASLTSKPDAHGLLAKIEMDLYRVASPDRSGPLMELDPGVADADGREREWWPTANEYAKRGKFPVSTVCLLLGATTDPEIDDVDWDAVIESASADG